MMKSTLSILFLMAVIAAFSQDDANPYAPEVTFETLYDEPYNVKKLFLGFQPFYGELFATNVNAGWGLDVHYFHKQKFEIRAHMRKTYSSSFFDITRENAKKNSDVGNKPEIFNYYELGINWHVKDIEDQGKTKVVLYKKSYKGDRWESRVPTRIDVPCKVRKIYSARIGSTVWNSTLDVSRAMQLDNKKFELGQNGSGQIIDSDTVNLFSNIYSAGIYAGGSMTWMRNVAVSIDQYEGNLDDGMLTLYADILYAPYLKVSDIEYNNTSFAPTILKLNSFGFRVGLDGKFNRKLSWGYGGEVGIRPSVAHLGFFAVVKIAIPLYGTNLNYQANSSSKPED
jgi:hypothetical protein